MILWHSCTSISQDLQYHGDSPSSKANKMVRILMFVRILSLVRLLRVSRLVRFFNEVEKVSYFMVFAKLKARNITVVYSYCIPAPWWPVYIIVFNLKLNFFEHQVSNANLEVVRVLFRILSLFMMIFLLCHWNGCVQYFVPMLEEFPSDCWVRRENLMVIW